MKLLALFSIVALASASTPSLRQAWHEGAALVAAPVVEYNVDGEQLRNDTILAMDLYLARLESDIDRQFAWGVREILQPAGLRFREIVDFQQLVNAGVADADQFDYQLWYLAGTFDTVVDLVRQGEKRLRAPIKSEVSAAAVAAAAAAAPQAGSLRYTLSQLFYDFENTLVQRDLGVLRSWLLQTFDAGALFVLNAAPAIEENYRQQHLWPTVKSLQQDATAVTAYDEAIQQYSTDVYWKYYVRARADLWALELP